MISHRIALLALMGTAACAADQLTLPAPQNPSSAVGTIVVSPRNAIIAVAGAVTLNVSGTTLAGAAITEFDSVRYELAQVDDSLRVALSSTGVITGRATSGYSPVRVNIYAYKGGVGAAAQVIVQVTPTALSNPTLSIQPQPGDSTRLYQHRWKFVEPIVRDATTGEVVPDVQLCLTAKGDDRKRVSTCDPELQLPGDDAPIATFSSEVGGELNYFSSVAAEGTAWIHAELNAYGTMLHDSVQYTLTYPFEGYFGFTLLNQGAATSNQFTHVTVAPGGVVYFFNQFPGEAGAATVSVTFDNPSAATSAPFLPSAGGTTGNITPLRINDWSWRRFANPGTYAWMATMSGNGLTGQTISGTITVK